MKTKIRRQYIVQEEKVSEAYLQEKDKEIDEQKCEKCNK